MSNFKSLVLRNNTGIDDLLPRQQDRDFLHRIYNSKPALLKGINTKSIVLILTRIEDPEVDRVATMLIQSGYGYLRINAEQLINEVTVSVSFDGGNVDGYVESMGERVEIENIAFIWRRHFHSDSFSLEGYSQVESYYIRDNWISLVNSLRSLPDVRWFNDPESEDLATKPVQLMVAAQDNIDVPQTVITNSPVGVGKFLDRNSLAFVKAVHHHFVEYPRDELNNAYGFLIDKHKKNIR
ncbi:MvdC/MvdD family ATP grasp protein [Lacticaseibacillus pantheris]|uniref:MvdC/MvdD family ATP grasp protein n=1 Tax=Lacticaseibacillus pantheris TaxID=171523 RepID=UPI0006D0E4FB|nr:hypothetical protein [Lacticaseibacillus pantheris]